jgi:hypothetical protein
MKTYCFKLYASKKNKNLHQTINIAGVIFNHCIALHKRVYRLYGKSLSCHRLKLHLTKLKKLPKYAFWNHVGSQTIQDIAERIDRAYKLFFRNLRHGVRTAPPGFKKVKKYKSFTLKQCGYKLLAGNKMLIQGKVYKFFKSREVEGRPKTVTVKRDTLRSKRTRFCPGRVKASGWTSVSKPSSRAPMALKKNLRCSTGRVAVRSAAHHGHCPGNRKGPKTVNGPDWTWRVLTRKWRTGAETTTSSWQPNSPRTTP